MDEKEFKELVLENGKRILETIDNQTRISDIENYLYKNILLFMQIRYIHILNCSEEYLMKGKMVMIMIDYIINVLLDTYIKFELKKIDRKFKRNHSNILPNYVLKRQIKIYNNGEIVFDSKNVDRIPRDIQYTIKCYGIPKNIKPNNKTPIIYHVNTTLSSIFPNEIMELKCINATDEMAI